MLNAYGEPQQVFWRAKVRRLDGSPVFDRAFCSSKAAGPPDEPQLAGHGQRPLASSANKKRKQSAKLFHLFLGNVVARMRRQARIKRLLHSGMPCQKCRDLEAVL